jgi:amino acid adenylation domain-containing protein
MSSEERQTGVGLTADDLELLSYLLLEEGVEEVASPIIAPRPNPDDLPLSFAQQRLWFIDQLEPGNAAYNIPAAVRLDGRLDVTVLARALKEIIERHEVLRTTFATVEGQPVQLVAEPHDYDLPVVELSHLPEAERAAEVVRRATAEAQQPFDLARGPLLRVVLLRIADERHVLLFTMHHIISDGWSMGVFVSEVAALYQALTSGASARLAPLPIQYADYAVWQREWLTGATLDEHIAFWRTQLEGVSVLELPTDRPRPAAQTFRGARLYFTLPAPLTRALKTLARQEEATIFMILLAAYKALLGRYSGQTDIAVGTPVAGRNRAETEGLIGFFVNTLVMRTDLSGQPSFRELLRRVREVSLESLAHGELPFQKLVAVLQPERDLSHTPLFQVWFALQNAPAPAIVCEGLTIETMDIDPGVSQFDLMLNVTEGEHELACMLGYNTDLFDAATIARFSAHFETLLAGAVANLDLPISELPLLTPAETEQLLKDWNDTRTEQPDARLHELFERQATRTPAAAAVVCDRAQLTYGELNERANRLARHLRQLGVGPEVKVGVGLGRSASMVVGLLGILKAGGAYVPLDLKYPLDHLAFILEDAQVSVLLTEEALEDRLPAHMAQTVYLDADWPLISEQPAENLSRNVAPENLAYVIYTSGSTGRPKGVMITHAGLSNYLSWAVGAYAAAGRGAPVHSSIAFDLTVTSLFVPLASGGAVHLVQEADGVDGLAHTLRQGSDFSLVKITPAHLELLRHLLPAEAAAGKTGVLVIGGEALTWPALAYWRTHAPETRLVNEYGPTETVVGCCVYEGRAGDPETGAVPIGRPVANTQLYLLDEAQMPVPVGVRGELYIGGAGVARGYLRRPDLTAERFVPDPFSIEPGARLYRTGDLARRLPEGELEYLGRLDGQVKLRGYRIELGEIEAALKGHPGINECAIALREDTPGEKRLVAYVVPEPSAPPTVAELVRYLKGRLPEYEVPTAFVTLEALPLTVNGKVDAQALPPPTVERATAERAFVAPRTPMEETLAGIWSEVLGVEQIGVYDGFFDLGGHSLLAVQVISRIRAAFDVEIQVRVLFESLHIAGLAEVIEAALGSGLRATSAPIRRRARGAELPLSFAQQRLWFIDQLEPGNAAYNIPAVLRLEGYLSAAALEETLNRLVARHESLRTTFEAVEGRVRQVIHPAQPVTLPVIDLTHLAEAEREAEALRRAAAETQCPFDLARGPLLRVLLLRLAEERHVLVVTMHHIVSDGWSMSVLVREVSGIYGALMSGAEAQLDELSIQYADYALWQREWLTGEVLERQLDYWRAQLAGVSVLELPTDRPRPAAQTYRGAQHAFSVEADILERLGAVGQESGATLFMILLAAFKLLLHRYSGQSSISVGTPVAGRNHAETENLIGCFINTLVLRTDMDGDPVFVELLARVRETALAAYAHQDVPFEALVEHLQPERDLSRTPLFQVMFVMQNAPVEGLELPGLTLSPVLIESGTTQLDLTLSVRETGRGLELVFVYNTDLFAAATIRRMSRHLETLLRAVAVEPQARISTLALADAAERRQLLVEWNATAMPYPHAECLHEMFEAQVERTPQAVAVKFAQTELTYTELNRRANQLAHLLRGLGVGAETPVGVLAERSLEMVVGLLGILKAGGAYVPLDPDYPAERLAFMSADARVPVLLTQKRFAGSLPASQMRVVCLDDDSIFVEGNEGNPARAATGANAAYIIYTSGSTGRPKGVVNTHRGICNRLRWMQDAYKLTPADSVLQKTTFSFDVSVWEFFWPLLAGARLVMAQPGLQYDAAGLVETIMRERVTTLHFVPSMLGAFLNEPGVEECSSLRLVVCSGEALPVHLQKLFFDRLPESAELHNLYGPTEAAVDVTSWACRREDERPSVPIGRPIANTQLYLLDANMRPVPVGVAGELYLGGAGLARGYLDRADLTAEKFVPDPFSPTPGARLYRTGDLARYDNDGALDFIGRLDTQVKVRGFRVELGEIEAALARHPSVREAVVVARADEPGDTRLVAYVVSDEPQLSGSVLRVFLKEQLPDYLIPAAFVTLAALPLTASGKVNRLALPPPDAARPETAGDYVAPRAGVEQRLAQLWAEVLRVERVGVHDNFFDLGGHSILLIQIRSKLRDVFDRDVPMADLFKYPTVSLLAQHLTREPTAEQFAAETHGAAKERREVTNRQRQSRLARRAAVQRAEVDDE